MALRTNQSLLRQRLRVRHERLTRTIWIGSTVPVPALSCRVQEGEKWGLVLKWLWWSWGLYSVRQGTLMESGCWCVLSCVCHYLVSFKKKHSVKSRSENVKSLFWPYIFIHLLDIFLYFLNPSISYTLKLKLQTEILFLFCLLYCERHPYQAQIWNHFWIRASTPVPACWCDVLTALAKLFYWRRSIMFSWQDPRSQKTLGINCQIWTVRHFSVFVSDSRLLSDEGGWIAILELKAVLIKTKMCLPCLCCS